MDQPSAKDSMVRRRDRDILQIRVKSAEVLAHLSFFLQGHWSSCRMQRAVGDKDSDDGAESSVQKQSE
jgi:hypothetical protein